MVHNTAKPLQSLMCIQKKRESEIPLTVWVTLEKRDISRAYIWRYFYLWKTQHQHNSHILLQAAIQIVQRISPILMKKPWRVFLLVVVTKMGKCTNQERGCLQSRIVSHGRISKLFFSMLSFKLWNIIHHALSICPKIPFRVATLEYCKQCSQRGKVEPKAPYHEAHLS